MADILNSRKKAMDEASRLAAIHAKVPVTDTSALDAQVADKRAAQAAATKRDLETAAELLANAQLAQSMEGKRQEDLASTRRTVGAFQEQQAAAYAPPSFDYTLEGPESAASLRCFAGEDQGLAQRKAQQAQQLTGWCEDSKAAREQATRERLEHAQKEHDSLMALVSAGQRLTQQQEGRKAQLAASVASANQALAAAKRERDEHAAAERAAGVMNALILDDGPTGAGVPRTEFRGYNAEQVRDVARAQEAQRAEAAAAEARQRAEARGEAVQAALFNKAAEKVTVGQLAFQQQQRAAVAAVVERQNEERRKLEEKQAAEAKQPNMTDDFQARFGNHAR